MSAPPTFLGDAIACGECGLRVREDHTYCGECGARIDWPHALTPSGARCTCGKVARDCSSLQTRLQIAFNNITHGGPTT